MKRGFIFKVAAVCFLLLFSAVFFGNYKKPVLSGLSDRFEVAGASRSGGEITLFGEDDFPLFGIYGESCFINLNGDFNDSGKEKIRGKEDIFDKFCCRIIFTEEVDGGTSYYCLSPKIAYATNVNGKKVNLQVFCGRDYLCVGTPVIYGSY